MLKLIFSLIWHKSSLKNAQLQIGAYLLKKSANIVIGEVLYQKKERFAKQKHVKVKVVTNILFDFKTNKIIPTTENKFVKATDISKA